MEKSWKEFRDSGALFAANTFLHFFGWCITVEMQSDEIINVYPTRTKFRGWSAASNDSGFQKLHAFLRDNIAEIHADTMNESKMTSEHQLK